MVKLCFSLNFMPLDPDPDPHHRIYIFHVLPFNTALYQFCSMFFFEVRMASKVIFMKLVCVAQKNSVRRRYNQFQSVYSANVLIIPRKFSYPRRFDTSLVCVAEKSPFRRCLGQITPIFTGLITHLCIILIYRVIIPT